MAERKMTGKSKDKRRLWRILALALAGIMVVMMLPENSLVIRAGSEEEVMTPGDNISYHGKFGDGDNDHSCIGLKKVVANTNRYGKVPVFNLLLKYTPKGNEIITSYGNRGYGSVAKIGSSVTGGKPLDVTKSTSLGNNVTVTMNFTGMSKVNIIRVGYEITNSGSSAQTVSVGGTVDTDIAGDDSAKIENFQSGDQVGLISTARGGEYLSFCTDGDYWYGKWSSTQADNNFAQYVQKAAGIKGKDRKLSAKDGTYDSCMSWIWQNVTVPAGETVTKYCYFGVGDLTAGDNPYAIKAAAAAATVTWDANSGNDVVGGLPADGFTAASVGDKVTLPTLTRDGYIFEGWYTQAAGGDQVTVDEDGKYAPTDRVTLYAHWRAIVSTVNVELKMGTDPYPWQSVGLYRNGILQHGLVEILDSNDQGTGTYSVGGVTNGTYTIGVNGYQTGDSVTVAATGTASTQTKNITVTMKKAMITTTLDGYTSDVPGEVTLRHDGKNAYTLRSSGNGVWEAGVIISAGGSFDVFVGGDDTGVDVTVGNLTKTINFHTAVVNISDDGPWETATVTLRDSTGQAVTTLPHTQSNGNIATYSKVIQECASELSVDLGGLDTGKTLGGSGAYTTNINCYTSTLRIACSDAGNLPIEASMRGSGRTYAFKKTTTTANPAIYTVEHVLDNGDTGYDVKTTGASKEGLTSDNDIKITGVAKTHDIAVYVVEFKQYSTSDGGNTYTASDSGSRAYVFNGGTVKGVDSYLSGYTFQNWSTSEWSKDELSFTSFDFEAPITGDKILYPHFLPPTVKINGFVRTNEAGELSSTGACYRMANLTITGFDTGDTIKYVLFKTENVVSLQSVGTLPSSTGFDATSGLLTFETPVTMKEARDTVRDHIVVTPENELESDESSMTVLVWDKNGSSAISSSGADGTRTTDVEVLTGSTTGKTLDGNKIYLVNGNPEYSNSTAGGSGITISGNVYIFVKSGCTLTATGASANGKTGAGAGINVSSGNTLYLLGDGAIYATGGNAANGSQGKTNNKTAMIWGDGYYQAGTGGAGGNGGGGAGAGIGGKGGNGGDGASAKDAAYYSDIPGYPGTTPGTHAGETTPANGNNGATGGNGESMGTIYISGSLSVTATKGSAGTTPSQTIGAETSEGSYGNLGYTANSSGSNWSNIYYAGRGGVGGNGAGGLAASDIGGGGAGGGGGGGGGSGHFSQISSGSLAVNSRSNGGDGGNGSSSSTVNNGKPGSTGPGGNKEWQAKPGGSGGAGGKSGSAGENGTLYIQSGATVKNSSNVTINGNSWGGSLTKTFAVNYIKGTDNGTVVGGTTSYTFGETSQTITIPGYTVNGDYFFRGWKLIQYAYPMRGTASRLTMAEDSVLFAPGTVIDVPSDAAGTIGFRAVVFQKTGLYAESERMVYKTVPPKSYTFTSKVNGEPQNVGVLIFTYTENGVENTEKVKGLNGVYSIATIAENVTVKCGDEVVAQMEASENNPTAVAEADFERVTVSVTGYKPSDLTLDGPDDGPDAPVLLRTDTKDATKTYIYESPYRKVADEKGEYVVRLDGTDVGKTASYGTTTKVAFHTLTIHIEPSTARNVILKDSAGNMLVTQKVGDGPSNTFIYTSLADDETAYDVYADGAKTGAIGVKFDSTRTVTASYYVATVTVKLDDSNSDVIGVPCFGSHQMVRKETGVFLYASESGLARDISILGEIVHSSAAADCNLTLSYYSITYDKAGSEIGEVPSPTYCLLGGKALLAPNSLINGAQNFGGWSINGTVELAGSEVSVTSASAATATWAQQSLNDVTSDGRYATVILDQDIFAYDGSAQTPYIKVYIGDELLTENTHYTVDYLVNSNPDEGAGAVNVRAGVVTVSIIGIGDYCGVLKERFEILPRLVSIGGLTATSRAYDGNKNVAINSSGATINGIADADKNDHGKLWFTGLAGEVDSAEVEVDENGDAVAKPVRIKKDSEGNVIASLTGTSASDYRLTGIDGETVTVTISKKALTPTSVKAYDKAYDGTTGAKVVSGSITFDSNDIPPEISKNLTVIAGDEAAYFADSYVGTNKPVTVDMSKLSLSGAAANNYTLAGNITTTASIVKGSQLAPSSGEGYEIQNGKILISQDTNNTGSPVSGTHYEILRFYPNPQEGTPDNEIRKVFGYNEGPIEINPDKYTYFIRWAGNDNFESSSYTEMIIEVPENKKLASMPKTMEGLSYSSTDQTGVLGGTGYILSGNYHGEIAGVYRATATLADGYVWPDGTSDPLIIEWTISKAQQKSPEVYLDKDSLDETDNPADVIIYPYEWKNDTDHDKGYKDFIEYSGDGGKTWITIPTREDERPGELTGVEPGKEYWFRYKGNDNKDPSPASVISITPCAPVPITKAPTSISNEGAVLNGAVLNTADINVSFQYRTPGAEWIDTDATYYPDTSTFSATLTGLTSDSEYEFRTVAKLDGYRDSYGKTVSFRTEYTEPPAPADDGVIEVALENNTSENIDVLVNVEHGNDPISSQSTSITGSNSGSVKFSGLPYGNYNVVVRADEYTETRMLSVTDSEPVTAAFMILAGKLATIVQVNGTDTPKIAVEGLNEIITKDDKDQTAVGGQDVEVKLEVEKLPEADAEGADEIKTLASESGTGKVIDTFLDMSLTKTTTQLDANGEIVSVDIKDIGKTNSKVLEMAIPYSSTGKRGISVFRCHNSIVGELMELSSRATAGVFIDGTFFVDAEYLFIYGSGFSTYAIGYDRPAGGGGGGGTAPADVLLTGVSVTGNAEEGILRIGETIAAVIEPEDAQDVTYEWYRDGELIGGATGSTYVIGAADDNKVITVKVIQKKGTEEEITVSASAGRVGKKRAETPAVEEIKNTLTFDPENEIIHVGPEFEVSLTPDDDPDKTYDSQILITDILDDDDPDNVIYVRRKGTEDTDPSDWVPVPLDIVRPDAPNAFLTDTSSTERGTVKADLGITDKGKTVRAQYKGSDGLWHDVPGPLVPGEDGSITIGGLMSGNVEIRIRYASTDTTPVSKWWTGTVHVEHGIDESDYLEQLYIIHYIMEYNGRQLSESTEPTYVSKVTLYNDGSTYGISANKKFYDEASVKLFKNNDNLGIMSFTVVGKAVYSNGTPVFREGSNTDVVEDTLFTRSSDEFVDDEAGIACKDIPILYNDLYVYANVGAYATDRDTDGVVISTPAGVKYSGLKHMLDVDPKALRTDANRSGSYDLHITVTDTKTKNADGTDYELIYGKDYTVSYKNNINASVIVSARSGEAYYKQIHDESQADKKWPQIIVKGKGNYAKMKAVIYFDILPLSVGETYQAVGNFADVVKDSYILKRKGGISFSAKPVRYQRKFDKLTMAWVNNDARTVKYKTGTDVIMTLQKQNTDGIWNDVGDLTDKKAAKTTVKAVTTAGTYRVKLTGKGNYYGTISDKFIVTDYGKKQFSKLKVKKANVTYTESGIDASSLVTAISTKVAGTDGKKVLIPVDAYSIKLTPVSGSASVNADGTKALTAGIYDADVTVKDVAAFEAAYPKVSVDGSIRAQVKVKSLKLNKNMFSIDWDAAGEAYDGDPRNINITVTGIGLEDLTLGKQVLVNGKKKYVPLTAAELAGALAAPSLTPVGAGPDETTVGSAAARITIRGDYFLSDGREVNNTDPGTYKVILYGKRGYADSTYVITYKRNGADLKAELVSTKETEFNAGGAMTSVTIHEPDGDDVVVSGRGDAKYSISYSSNKAVGDGTATVTVKDASTGYKKGTTIKATFKIAAKEVESVRAYSEYDSALAGELFIRSMSTAQAGKSAPAYTIYQASADGKKLVSVNKAEYVGVFNENLSVTPLGSDGTASKTYDLTLTNGTKGDLDFGKDGVQVEKVYSEFTAKAKKFTAQKELKVGTNIKATAALIRNTGDNRIYSSEDIAEFGKAQTAVNVSDKGVITVTYAGGCYILPQITELTVTGADGRIHTLKLEDGDYIITYAKNDRVGTGKMTVTISQEAALKYGIGGSKTYTFKIVRQTGTGLKL